MSDTQLNAPVGPVHDHSHPVSDGWGGIEVEVQSSHVDMFGHANHTRYLEWMEWARFAWSEWHGFPIPRMIEEQRIGPAVIRVHINYRRECRFGDKLRVHAAAWSARRSIGVIRQEIWDARSNVRVCDADVTCVMLTVDARRSAPLPEASQAAAHARAELERAAVQGAPAP